MKAYKKLAKPSLTGLLFIVACTGDNGGGTGVDNSGNGGGDPIDPPGSPPATPSFTQVFAISQEPQRGMHLIINDASTDEDGFRIERRVQGGAFTQIAALAQNTATYDDWGLGISTSYTYRINASNAYGSSPWSAERTATATGSEPGFISLYPTADAYVQEAFPTQNKGDDTYLLVTGSNSGLPEKRSYLRFNFADIPSYAIATDTAQLRLISQNESTVPTALVAVQGVASSWSESTITWSNRPIGRGLAADARNVYNDGQPVYWDISSIVRRWFEGTTLNHGIELFSLSTNSAVLYSRERSQLEPLLVIKYLW